MLTTPLTIYCMGARGLAVLRRLGEVAPNGFSDLRAVIARDAAMGDDGFDALADFCTAQSLTWCERRDAGPAPGWAMAIGWRWMISPCERLIVLHDSLLPRYRGFAPVVAALLEREPRIGVTSLLASEQFDRGPILGQRSIEVDYPIKVADLLRRLLPLYAELAADAAATIFAGAEPRGAPQDESLATYSPWRDAEDYRIDWTRPSDDICDHINAVGAPYLGAATLLENRLVRIFDATPMPDVHVHGRPYGKVLQVDKGLPVVICGRGLLRLNDIRDAETAQSLLPLRRFRSRFI